MAKFYWKGTAAGFTTDVTGASYDSWIAATNAGLTKNWANSVGTIGSGVTGATLIPGVNDLVYISDRFPTLGSTLSGSTGSGSYTYVLSPCLNSGNAGITAYSCTIGPFSNLSSSATLPLVTGIVGHSRVGGNVLGNSAVSETSGVTGATLVGYPMQLRVSNQINIYDNDMGSFDINIAPNGGFTYSQLIVTRVTPTSGVTLAGAFTLAEKPWKTSTAIRVSQSTALAGWSVKNLTINSGVVMSELTIGDGVGMDTPSAASAVPVFRIYGQIFNTTVDYSVSSGTVIKHVLIDPNIRCFDSSAAGTYILANSIVRSGDSADLSPQTSVSYADLLLYSAKRATGIATGTVLSYNVTLGTNPFESAVDATTSYKFVTVGQETGSPNIKLRGTISSLKDFVLNCGKIELDSSSVVGQQGVVIYNGKILSQQQSDFGGLVRLTAINDELIPATGVGAINGAAQGRYGLRLGETASLNTKLPISSTIETHANSTL